MTLILYYKTTKNASSGIPLFVEREREREFINRLNYIFFKPCVFCYYGKK